MTFIIIRIVLAAVTFAVGALIIKKIRTPDVAVARIFLIVLVMAQTSVLCLFPVENYLFSFESVENAYHYANSGEIETVIEGEDSELVVGKNDNVYVYLVIPKTKHGFKASVGADLKRVFYNFTNGIRVEIYQHRSIDDFYVSVTDTGGGDFSAMDNVNSEFYPVAEEIEPVGEIYYTYYAFINAENGQYELTVNGETVAKLDSLGGWFYQGRKVNR